MLASTNDIEKNFSLRYVKRRSLYYHKQQHFKDKFVCLDCGIVCENAEDISIHHKEHEEQKQFKCSKCNQKFSRRQQYLFHMKVGMCISNLNELVPLVDMVK